MTLAIPVNVDFSPDGIRAMREGLGMNQSEFADLLGVTRVTVWHWENGKQRPAQNYCRQALREAQEELNRRNSQT